MLTSEEIKRLMQKCIIGVLYSNMDGDDAVDLLGSIIFVLHDSGTITSIQKEECVFAFFHEYNNGLKEPMSDEYISSTLIPYVLNPKTLDINLACEFIDRASTLANI